jgi:hypothetical protein
LISNAPSVVIQPPQQVKKDINEKKKENDLLETREKILAIEPVLNNGFKKLKRFINYNQN